VTWDFPVVVFRYFPTKEDLVLADEYDPVILDRIRARPADEPLMRRISTALVESTAEHSPGERAMLLARLRLGLTVPALRARMWDGQYQTQCYLVEVLRGDYPTPEHEFELWVVTGACLAAATAAIVHWAERGGQEDLAQLMASALRLVTPSGSTHAGSQQ
jgi:AcrR family transcriptional regulator